MDRVPQFDLKIIIHFYSFRCLFMHFNRSNFRIILALRHFNNPSVCFSIKLSYFLNKVLSNSLQKVFSMNTEP